MACDSIPDLTRATPSGYRDRACDLLDQLLEADSQQQAQQRLEQSAEELKEKVIWIFPNKASAWRLVGALLAKKQEEWSTGRRYLTMDEFCVWREEQTEEPQKLADERQSEFPNHTLQPV